jgi:hypothetical protein
MLCSIPWSQSACSNASVAWLTRSALPGCRTTASSPEPTSAKTKPSHLIGSWTKYRAASFTSQRMSAPCLPFKKSGRLSRVVSSIAGCLIMNPRKSPNQKQLIAPRALVLCRRGRRHRPSIAMTRVVRKGVHAMCGSPVGQIVAWRTLRANASAWCDLTICPCSPRRKPHHQQVPRGYRPTGWYTQGRTPAPGQSPPRWW